MICVTVEIVPGGFEPARRTIGSLRISNVSDLAPISSYEVVVLEAMNPLCGTPSRIWSNLGDGQLMAGRADAVAVRGEERLAVLDWKSDISPSREDRSGHIAQLKDYVKTIGAPKGAIVYMSLGEVVWIQPRATTSIA